MKKTKVTKKSKESSVDNSKVDEPNYFSYKAHDWVLLVQSLENRIRELEKVVFAKE